MSLDKFQVEIVGPKKLAFKAELVDSLTRHSPSSPPHVDRMLGQAASRVRLCNQTILASQLLGPPLVP